MRHAAFVTRSRSALARMGGCAAARTLTSAADKSCARNSCTAVSDRYRNPPASTSNLLITGDEGPSLSTSVVDSPMSGAHAAM